MIIQTGGARRVYGGGRRGLGDDSITVTDTAEPIPYDYADVSTAPILTYSGGDQPNTTDVSNYMNWITGATPAPASPVFFPSSGGGSGAAVSSLTSLAAQIANLFRPTAAAPAASAAQASAAAPAGSAASWFAKNQGLVIGGGIGLVALLVLMKGGRR